MRLVRQRVPERGVHGRGGGCLMSATLTADEDRMVTLVPRGYRERMLLAAYTKYGLAHVKMNDADRLHILELLNSLTDGYFSEQMLATIQPMCRTQVEMMH